MIAWLNNFSILSRLALMVGLACLVLLLGTVPRITAAWNTMQDMEQTRQVKAVAGAASAIVHQMQIERGTSATLLAALADRQLQQQLTQARAATNKSLAAYSALISDPANAEAIRVAGPAFGAIAERMAGLEDMRGKVDARATTGEQSTRFYTGLIQELLNLYGLAVQLGHDQDVALRGAALLPFLQAKDAAGLERSTGSSGLAAGLDYDAVNMRLQQHVAAQDALFAAFRKLALPQHQEQLDAVLASDAVQQLNAMRSVLASGDDTAASGAARLSPADWFALSTTKVNQLYALEQQVADGIDAAAAAAAAKSSRSFYQLLTIDIVSLALLLGAALILARSISQPLVRLMHTADCIGKGETDIEVPFQQARSEIGAMARNLASFAENLAETDRLRAQKLEEDRRMLEEQKAAAERERRATLERQAQEERRRAERQRAISTALLDLSQTIEQDISKAMDEITRSTSNGRQATDRMVTFSGQVRAGMSSASDAAGIAAGSAQSIAAAAEELNASINEITRQMEASQALVRETSDEAQATRDGLTGLTNAAQNISSVVALISEIAEQTNLLALNATIEAARAGSAGKGFAVVASEVKNLAAQTAQSTDEISRYVEEMETQVQRAVERVGQIAGRVEQVADRSGAVSAAVTQQSATTAEIARSIGSASESVDTVASQVGDVAGDVNQMADISTDLGNLVQQIDEQTLALKRRLAEIVAQVRGRSDRREDARYTVKPDAAVPLTLDIAGHGTFEVLFHDISRGGAKVTAPVPIHYEGEPFAVLQTTVGGLDCQIVWRDGDVLGLNFLDRALVQP